jgi:hypothetical protein
MSMLMYCIGRVGWAGSAAWLEALPEQALS